MLEDFALEKDEQSRNSIIDEDKKTECSQTKGALAVLNHKPVIGCYHKQGSAKDGAEAAER